MPHFRAFSALLKLLFLFALIGLGETAYGFQGPNQIHTKKIRTLLVKGQDHATSPPIMELNGSNSIHIRFDYMDSYPPNLGYRLIHANHQWENSDLMTNEYMEGYDENRLTDYDFSQNTVVDYTHFHLQIPNIDCTPIVSGNYIVEIFSFDNTEEVLCEAGFLVYESLTGFQGGIRGSSQVERRNSHHELFFTLETGLLGNIIQATDYRVMVLQNFRWDNAQLLENPRSFSDNKLHFDRLGGIEFEAGNEYRNYDLRDFFSPGLGIWKIESGADTTQVYALTEKPRRNLPYFSNPDINGNLAIENPLGYNPHIDSDYAWVHLFLKTDIPYGAGFVELTSADMTPFPEEEKQLLYNLKEKGYIGRVLLKQGYYNWLYGVRREKDHPLKTVFMEGSFFETQNNYQVLVYYRGFSSDFDRLVGFFTINS